MVDISQDDIKAERVFQAFHAPYLHGPASRISTHSYSTPSRTSEIVGIVLFVMGLIVAFGCLCKAFSESFSPPDN